MSIPRYSSKLRPDYKSCCLTSNFTINWLSIAKWECYIKRIYLCIGSVKWLYALEDLANP